MLWTQPLQCPGLRNSTSALRKPARRNTKTGAQIQAPTILPSSAADLQQRFKTFVHSHQINQSSSARLRLRKCAAVSVAELADWRVLLAKTCCGMLPRDENLANAGSALRCHPRTSVYRPSTKPKMPSAIPVLLLLLICTGTQSTLYARGHGTQSPIANNGQTEGVSFEETNWAWRPTFSGNTVDLERKLSTSDRKAAGSSAKAEAAAAAAETTAAAAWEHKAACCCQK